MNTGSPSRIAVGVDGSEGSALALRWAADEADLHGATLTAVTAWGFLDQHLGSERFDPHYDEQDALTTLRHFLAETLGDTRAADIDAVAICDRPTRALTELSADVDLLVIGARGLGGFRGLLLGSVSHHCLQHATTPVAVIKATPHPRPAEDVVVAVDGSATADQALEWAAAEARRRATSLTLVHAWQLPALGYDPMAAAALDTTALEHAAQATAAAALARLNSSDLDVRSVVERGNPSQVIIETGREAALIVLGTRGRSGLKRVILGSVATQVAQHASSPVVVIPPTR